MGAAVDRLAVKLAMRPTSAVDVALARGEVVQLSSIRGYFRRQHGKEVRVHSYVAEHKRPDELVPGDLFHYVGMAVHRVVEVHHRPRHGPVVQSERVMLNSGEATPGGNSSFTEMDPDDTVDVIGHAGLDDEDALDREMVRVSPKSSFELLTSH